MALHAPLLHAQDTTRTRPDTAVTIGGIKITATTDALPRVSPLQRLTLPAIATVSRDRVERVVNVLDSEDALKYLPSIFLRKRNNGDTQATVATRVWGTSSSARSLVFADGIPLTALVANNNTIGGPRWGLVAPEEIARIDVMYGPFSAAYAGNSMGAVMEITTRMPTKLEASLSQTGAFQRFDLYGTRDTYRTSQTSALVGDRFGKLSFWLSGNYQNSHSQPLSYVVGTTFPTGTTGGFADQNKLGAAANVLGASGLLRTEMTNAKAKLAYDLTPSLRATYTFGYWSNEARSNVDTYLARTSGATYAGLAGFASGYYDLTQRHSSHALSLRTDRGRDWDAEAMASLYRFDTDRQRLPSSASAIDTAFGTPGRLVQLDGTGWGTIDVKGAWHRGGAGARHVVSAGAHLDQYRLANPTYTTPEWRNGAPTAVATEGDGRTRTTAVWAQDAWRLASTLRLTVGGRYESWRGFDGYNANGTTTVVQPEASASKFSPKAILAWTPTLNWALTASAAKAYRFATAAELYQLVSTGTTFTSPDPNLEPDDVLAAELRVERYFGRGKAQLSLFQDDVHDAIISQFLPLVPNSATLYSFLSNVDHVRARGAELSLGSRDLLLHGLELTGNMTYLDARTLALSGRASATAPAGSAVGRFLPNTPRWRGSFAATYRPRQRAAFTVAGRYSDKLYTTLDNADVRFNTYQGFSEWFALDARVNYQLDRRLSASLGVDNLLDRKYFLFHPFPQRTLVGSLRVGL